jgi:hypothetical protein
VIIGQIGDISCGVITILHLSSELAVFKPEIEDRGEDQFIDPS